MTTKNLAAWHINPVTGKLYNGAPFPEALRFPVGYFEPAVMPMTVVRPAVTQASGKLTLDQASFRGKKGHQIFR